MENAVPARCQMGVIPINPSNSDFHEFLVFGGLLHYLFNSLNDDKLANDIYIIKIDNGAKTGGIVKMKKQLQVSDRIYFNQSILIDDERLIYGVPGREAFHIFDLH